jgi:hypothetical protein
MVTTQNKQTRIDKTFKIMWHKIFEIIDWFGEMSERFKLVKDFNRAGKNAFISGQAPTLLEAKVTNGNSAYRHQFSRFLGGGFRIKALSGRPLKKDEMIEIGKVILDNKELVRKLIALGWDTLEVHDNAGYNGCQWCLKDHANIGGYLK